MDSLLFDIIIPTYNNLPELKACLYSFEKQTLTSFRVFVGVDGSTDGTLQWLKETNFSYPLFVLHHPDFQNRGRNATRNLALPHLKATFTLYLDSDICPDPSLLEEHARVLKQISCVSHGVVEYKNKRESLWAAYISSRGYNKYSHGEAMPFHYLNMGNVALQTLWVLEMNGLDANLVKYGGDDTEFSIRLWEKYRITVINNTKARGYAFLNKPVDFALSQMEEFGQTNLYYIYKKHPRHRNIYYTDFMAGDTSWAFLRSIFFNPLNVLLAKNLINWAPQFVKLKALHYLVAHKLYTGFQKN